MNKKDAERFFKCVGNHPSETKANFDEVCKFYIKILKEGIEESRLKSKELAETNNPIANFFNSIKNGISYIFSHINNEIIITDLLLLSSMSSLEPNVINYYRIIHFEVYFSQWTLSDTTHRIEKLQNWLASLPFSELQNKALNVLRAKLEFEPDFFSDQHDENKIIKITAHEPNSLSTLYPIFLLYQLSHLQLFEDFLNYQSKLYRKGNFAELVNKLVTEDKADEFPILIDSQRTQIQIWLDKQHDFIASKEATKPHDFIEIHYNKKENAKELFRYLYSDKVKLITADDFEELFKFGFGYSQSKTAKIKLKESKNRLYGFLYCIIQNTNINVSREDLAMFIIHNFAGFKNDIQTMKTNFKEEHYIKNKVKIDDFINTYRTKKP